MSDALDLRSLPIADALVDPGVLATLHLEAGAGHRHITEPSDPTALPTVEAISSWIAARA